MAGRKSIIRTYYLPGEFCQPIGKQWFFADGDLSRSADELLEEYRFCRKNEINYLLDVPPDKLGLIPDDSVKKLMELKKELHHENNKTPPGRNVCDGTRQVPVITKSMLHLQNWNAEYMPHSKPIPMCTGAAVTIPWYRLICMNRPEA